MDSKKVYVITRGEGFPEEYIDVKPTKRKAEAMIRKMFPNAKAVDEGEGKVTSYQCKLPDGSFLTMCIHEEVLE